MTGIEAFLAMGGYAGYVWPAYGIAAAAMIWLAISYIGRLHRTERQLAALVAVTPKRQGQRGRARDSQGLTGVPHDA